MRQLPIETNPPDHSEYRAIVEPFFQRSKTPEVIAKVEALIAERLTGALDRESVEVVNEFALPIQSYALTYLLKDEDDRVRYEANAALRKSKASDSAIHREPR